MSRGSGRSIHPCGPLWVSLGGVCRDLSMVMHVEGLFLVAEWILGVIMAVDMSPNFRSFRVFSWGWFSCNRCTSRKRAALMDILQLRHSLFLHDMLMSPQFGQILNFLLWFFLRTLWSTGSSNWPFWRSSCSAVTSTNILVNHGCKWCWYKWRLPRASQLNNCFNTSAGNWDHIHCAGVNYGLYISISCGIYRNATMVVVLLLMALFKDICKRLCMTWLLSNTTITPLPITVEDTA